MNDTEKWKWTTAQIALVVVGLPLFAAALVWTHDTPAPARGLILLGIALPFTAVGYFIDARAQRYLDEMEIAARGFAARWSIVAVVLLVLLTVFFVPFHSMLNALYAAIPPDRDGPPQMFALGIIAAVIVRGLAATLLRAAWLHAKR